MTIAFSKYIQITSAVVNAGQAVERELIGRIFTTNPLAPSGSVLEFTSADDVGTYFGTSSEEYARAAFYFGWVSKNATRAQKISYAFWNDDTATAPRIYGVSATYSLSTFTPISGGSFHLDIGGTGHDITGLDFTGALSLSDVASVIEAGIQAADVAAVWTGASVTYNATTKRFEFLGGATGANTITVSDAGSGTAIRNLIGWGANAITSAGTAAESAVDAVIRTTALTDNFGSLLFESIDSASELEVAQWVAAQNVKFFYCQKVDADTVTFPLDTDGVAGTATTASNDSGYPEMIPMIIFAATDYTKVNASQNYMYQVFDVNNLTIGGNLISTAQSDTFDENRVNYYAATQTAGRLLSFYQRGYIQGGATDPSDINVYANEIWLKDAIGTAIMNLFLTVTQVPANDQGRSMVMNVILGKVNLAENNGVISVGKPITDPAIIADITQISGDPNAWIQVQNRGYWLNAVVETYNNGGNTEWKAAYTLIYSKDDAIRKVTGSHILV